MANPSEKKHILLLGCGITSLQTTLSLLTSSPAYKITLLSSHLPGDSSPSYTSPLAGAHWRSHASLSPSDERVRRWDARTYAAWRSLLLEGDGVEGSEGEGYEERVKRIGLGFKDSHNFFGSSPIPLLLLSHI
jgi:glycine/D-amino acid oxidase-like deaminating enzyme